MAMTVACHNLVHIGDSTDELMDYIASAVLLEDEGVYVFVIDPHSELPKLCSMLHRYGCNVRTCVMDDAVLLIVRYAEA